RARGHALVRRGAAGCLLAGPSVQEVPSPEVEAVDLTGAGDTHTAAFADGLANGSDPLAAARRANRAAAWSVTRHGPATGPTSTELADWLPPDPPARTSGGQGRGLRS
ncbi:MAG: sugar kinase, partial [Actinobacteria bacterium]|nr:sugar kinase [Actinomycetota bacterium]